jgi:signal transduction histidine kinase
MVERNIEQISGIVTDMLIYSRERTPNYQMISPNELVSEVLELVYQRAKLAGVSLEREFDPDLTPVAMDRTGIYRCLLNLISNAVDACTLEGIVHGKGIVKVKTDRPAGWGVRFQVKDNGTGMDEATRKRLFADFFTTKGYKGTGLGLPVTDKIVREHEGELFFDSNPGCGTTFSLLLPERPPS